MRRISPCAFYGFVRGYWGCLTIESLSLQDILRNVNKYGPRTTRARDVKSLMYHLCDFMRTANLEVVFGNRLRHTNNVNFLKGTTSNEMSCDLTRNGNDGGRVHPCCR